MDKATQAPSGDSVQRLFERCCSQLANQDPEAKRLLPQLERYPHYTPGWLQVGRTLLQLGQLDAAKVVFRRVLAHEQGNAMALYGLSEVFFRESRPAAVMELLAQVVPPPTHPRLHVQAGRALYARGALAEAEQRFDAATSAAPDDAEAWFRLGLTRQDLGRHREAAACYQRALALHPDLYEAALNLGIVLQETRDLDAAMAAYRQAVALNPACFNRVAQALTSASSGRLWLSLDSLRRELGCPL